MARYFCGTSDTSDKSNIANSSDASKTSASVTWLSSYFSILRPSRWPRESLPAEWRHEMSSIFFFDLRDDISYVQILYNAKWSYLCISDISAVLGNNNQKRIWFLDDNIWFDAVKETIQKNKMKIFNCISHEGGSRVPLPLFSFFLLKNRFFPKLI